MVRGRKYTKGESNMKVETELEGLLEALAHAVEDAEKASRVTNALLLAEKLGVNMTEPLAAQKVMRHLESVEKYVNGSDAT